NGNDQDNSVEYTLDPVRQFSQGPRPLPPVPGLGGNALLGEKLLKSLLRLPEVLLIGEAQQEVLPSTAILRHGFVLGFSLLEQREPIVVASSGPFHNHLRK